MRNKFRLVYNPFFHGLLLLWVVAGAVLLSSFDKRTLFETVNSHYTDFWNVGMYIITFIGQPEVIIPVLLLLTVFRQFRNWWYILTAIVCNVAPLIVQQTMKHLMYHPRPLKFFSHAEWIHFEKALWPELTGNNSFPSGHSQGAFSFFCFLSLLLPAKYRPFGALFFFAALSVCYSRMYLAAHFFADVYTGSIIGAVTTTLLFSIMQVYRKPTGIMNI